MSSCLAVVATRAPVPHSARMVPHIMARPGVNLGSSLRGGGQAGRVRHAPGSGRQACWQAGRQQPPPVQACEVPPSAAGCRVRLPAAPPASPTVAAGTQCACTPPYALRPAPVASHGGRLHGRRLDLAQAQLLVIGGARRRLLCQPLAVGHCREGAAGRAAAARAGGRGAPGLAGAGQRGAQCQGWPTDRAGWHIRWRWSLATSAARVCQAQQRATPCSAALCTPASRLPTHLRRWKHRRWTSGLGPARSASPSACSACRSSAALQASKRGRPGGRQVMSERQAGAMRGGVVWGGAWRKATTDARW